MSRSVISILTDSTTDTLGLDPARYATNTGQVGEKQFFTFESQISDKERFKDVDPLSLRCPSCQGSFAFEGLLDDTVSQATVPTLDLADSTGKCSTT
jgi:hypothetical protein